MEQPVYAPVVNSFTANPNYIQPGQATTLSWAVSNANSLTISPSVGSVSNSGSYTLTPGSTTTYTLLATNNSGTVSASTTVTVAPYITTYSTSSGAGTGTSESSIVTGGVSGGNSPAANLWLSYILLIGLLAVAAGVIVFLAIMKPATAQAGRHAATRAAYLPSTAATMPATGAPHTTPIAAGPLAKLVSHDGEEISISGGANSLGRNDFQSLLTPDKAALISRQHILVDYENGRYYIEDHNSTNGTRLNGASISGKGKHSLENGDVIELADALTLTFNI